MGEGAARVEAFDRALEGYGSVGLDTKAVIYYLQAVEP